MAFSIVHGDIVTMDTDAIVNAANSQLLAGSGVCGAIFRAAGERAGELQAECLAKAPCPTGQSVLTDSYGLKAKYIIHTVGPVWQGGTQGEKDLLYSCYRTALDLAADAQCKSIAFPLISAGIFGYPKEEALAVARQAVTDFLAQGGYGRSLSALSLTGGLRKPSFCGRYQRDNSWRKMPFLACAFGLFAIK